jgi:enoyl-CoA hydratase/carnithine racemase
MMIGGRVTMSDVTIDRRGDVAVVRMGRGATNAIGRSLVADLARAIEDVRGDAGGVVLAGGAKFFSIGIDLPELLQLDRKALEAYWAAFNGVCLDLFTLPGPTACAIAGHAIAGGTILALMSDVRLIATGRKLMGLNEVKLGVSVPYLPALVLRQLVGDRAATELVYHGELVEPEKAHALGLVDRVLEPDALEAAAVSWVAEHAALPRPSFAAIKRVRVEDVRAKFERWGEEKTQEFLDCWFLDQTQALLKKAAEKF